MDAELNTILQNIMALCQQAAQLAGGEGTPGMEKAEDKKEDEFTPEMVDKLMKALKGEDEEEKKEELEKGCGVKKSDEGTTANDTAEQRIDDQGDVNDKNISEVAKMMRSMVTAMATKANVKKSENNPMNELVKVVTSIIEENRELRKSMESVIEGLGIADEIKKVNTPAKRDVLVNDPNEIKKSIDYVRSALGLEPVASTEAKASLNPNGNHEVAKSLADIDILKGIFAKNARNHR